MGAVFIGLCLTIRYHLGTLAFGALILAVMQVWPVWRLLPPAEGLPQHGSVMRMLSGM